jgi:peptidoglycan hydrolase-like protein with peptidoglycan-binding domain
VAAVTLGVAAAVVVGTIVATGGGQHEVAGSPRTAAGAATIERRNLVTSEAETGTISYADPSTVANRLQGTLTWVPAVGRMVDPGQKLFAVDNFPVILMNGTTPAYRTLDSSDSAGPDVQQLNANLIELGFDPDGIVDDDEWQPATTAGVEDLQEANGEPQTGSLTLGTIVFLRGAQRVAGEAGGATTTSDDTVVDHAEFVSYTPTTPAGTFTTPAMATTETIPTTPTTPAPTAPDRSDGALTRAVSRLSTKVQQLQRQSQRLQHALAAAKSHTPPKSPAASGDSGPASGGDSPVMTTTSTNLVVTVDVAAGEQGVTHVGARVPVVMPSGSTVHGHVTKIGQATSTGGSATVPITIHLDKHANGRDLDQAAVSVTFIEKTARHVLSVPVTALLAQPGGRYEVQAAQAPYTLIDVTLGTFATGYVQVSGRGLHPGLKITDSQG